jgi:hypothetical protein
VTSTDQPTPAYDDAAPAGRPAEPHRRPRWLVPVITGVGGLLVGSLAAGGGASPTAAPASTVTATPTAAPAPTATVTAPPVTATVTAKPAPAPTATRTVKVTPAPTAAFGEGVYLVGVDVKPGRYRTTTSVTGQDCYWEIDRAPGSDDIVQNDNPAGGRPLVVLRSGQQFSSERCGDWGRS